MRRIRLVVMTGIFAALLAVAPAVASAVAQGPARTPVNIVSEGFDTGATPTYSLAADPMCETYWGPITQRFHGGDRGLWCAGTGPAGFTPNTWDYLVHKYQPAVEDPITLDITGMGTGGTADFLVPQLSAYYSSKLAFYYSMPSIGAADVFQVWWAPVPGNPAIASPESPNITAPLTADNGWQKKEYALSDPAIALSNNHNLSGKTGFFRFQWRTDATNLNNTNQGATIDDVLISGYKYGPVRNLAKVVSVSGVKLTWDKPYRYTYASDLETRTISYRVWREDVAAPGTYTELTASTRATDADRSLTDSSGVAGHGYKYYVQAWDAGTGVDGWGELANPVSVGNGAVSGTVTGPGGAPLAGVTVALGSDSTLTAADGTYALPNITPGTHSVTFTKSGYIQQVVSAVVVAEGSITTQNASMPIVVVTTQLSMPSVSPSRPKHGKNATFTTYLTPDAAGTTRLAFSHWEYKTVTKVVRGKRKRVKVGYWRLRTTRTLSAGGGGRFYTTYKLPSAGKWRLVASFTPSTGVFTAATSGTKAFTAR